MTQESNNMTHPTDEELEAMAQLWARRGYVSPPRNPEDYTATATCKEAIDTANMLRACKGRAEWANNPLTHKLLESRDFEEARAEALDAKMKEALSVLKDMRDDKTGYRHAAHFRRRAAVYLASLEGDKG